MQNNKNLAFIIIGLMFVLYSTCVFFLLAENKQLLIISYIFTVIATVVFIMVISKSQRNVDVFLKIPAISLGGIYVVIQMTVSLLFLILDINRIKVYIVVEFAICISMIILILSSFLVRNSIYQRNAYVDSKTAYVKNLQTDVEAFMRHTDSDTVRKELQKLVDTIKYSDPMSSEMLKEIEQEIDSNKAKLNKYIAEDNKRAISIIHETMNLLEKRNNKCKILK